MDRIELNKMLELETTMGSVHDLRCHFAIAETRAKNDHVADAHLKINSM